MTPLMMAALSDAAKSELFSWDYASGTLGSLKRCGWVRQVDSTTRGRRYGITDEGRAAYEKALAEPGVYK